MNGMVLKWGTNVGERNSGSWVMRLTGAAFWRRKRVFCLEVRVLFQKSLELREAFESRRFRSAGSHDSGDARQREQIRMAT